MESNNNREDDDHADRTSQDEIDRIWREEIERRIRAVDEGCVTLIPGDEALAQLRSRFK